MDIDIRTHNITQQLEHIGGDKTPEIILKRDAGPNDRSAYTSTAAPVTGTWHILNSQLPQKMENLSWSLNKKSPDVRIPMRRYYLNEQSAEVLIQFGMQLSALAIAVGRLQIGKEPQKLYVAISNVFNRADDKPGYAVYVGIAFLE